MRQGYKNISSIGLFLRGRSFNNHFNPKVTMFRRLRELYREYKEYVRVDLVMYAVMLLLVLLYVIFSVLG